MERKKIAFVNDTFLQGRGADTMLYEIARRIGKKHEVYILTGETNIPEENFKIIKVQIPKLYTASLEDFAYFKKMRILSEDIHEIDQKIGFDKILVFHGGLSPAFTGNKKVIYVWLGSPKTYNPLRRLVSEFYQRKMKHNKVITISDFLNEELKKRGIKKTKVIILGASDDFKPLRGNPDKQYMLYVGRLEKHKNVNDLIKISKEVNFQLIVAGYGPEEENLKKLAHKLKSPVTFLGRVSRDKLIQLYQEASFFVSASKWEGFGLIFVEAGFCGKTSIGYNAGSIPEVIKNTQTGFIVNNYSTFLEKVKLLKENRKLRDKLGNQAIEYYRKKFNWDRVAKEYETEIKK